MPLTTRTFLRAAFVWLVVGALAWAGQGTVLAGTLPARSAALHSLTVGWLTQVVFGVAIWLFPKRRGDHPRGREWVAWVTWALLNAGVLVRIAFEGAGGAPWVGALGALLQLLATLGFVLLMRGRVRGR